eukprot:4184012-Lingulodinium_polyedra.AAC.1
MSTETMTSLPPAGAAAAWAASKWNCMSPTRRWPLKACRRSSGPSPHSASIGGGRGGRGGAGATGLTVGTTL